LLVPVERGGLGLTDSRFCQLSSRALVETAAFGLAWSIGLHAAVALPVVDRFGGDQTLPIVAAAASGASILAVAGLAGGIRLAENGTLTGIAHSVPTAEIADYFVVVAAGEDDAVHVVVLPRSSVVVTRKGRGLGATDAGARDVDVTGAQTAAGGILRDGAAEFVLAQAAATIAGVAVAGARFCLDETAGYVNERRVFGRPVAEFDNTRVVMAEAHARTTAAERLLDMALGDSAGMDPTTAAMIAVVGVAAFDAAADLGIQLHGGYGYMTEYPISHAFAAARYLRLAFDAMPDLIARLATDAGLRPAGRRI
jgi:acyl-CoA dehydrogenase